MSDLKKINELSHEEAKDEFSKYCGSSKWVQRMISSRPFKIKGELFKAAEKIWYSLDKEDWLEAFSHHPKIGDLKSLKEKFSSIKNLAENEQSGVKTASIKTLIELERYNEEYEKKFGYIFIICATGKPADDMLSIIKKRIKNEPTTEIQIAMKEQNKITKLRLEKLL